MADVEVHIHAPFRRGVDVLTNDTLLPTLTGWTTIGGLSTADFIFDRDGQPVRVEAKVNRVVDRALVVEFDDGCGVAVSPDHEFQVVTAGREPMRLTLPARRLNRMLTDRRGQRQLLVVNAGPLS